MVLDDVLIPLEGRTEAEKEQEIVNRMMDCNEKGHPLEYLSVRKDGSRVCKYCWKVAYKPD